MPTTRETYDCIQSLRRLLTAQWDICKQPKLFTEQFPSFVHSHYKMTVPGFTLSSDEVYVWHKLIRSMVTKKQELTQSLQPKIVDRQVALKDLSVRVFSNAVAKLGIQRPQSHVTCSPVRRDWVIDMEKTGSYRPTNRINASISYAYFHCVGKLIYDQIGFQPDFLILHASRIGNLPDHITLFRVNLATFGKLKTKPELKTSTKYLVVGINGAFGLGATVKEARRSVMASLSRQVTERLTRAV